MLEISQRLYDLEMISISIALRSSKIKILPVEGDVRYPLFPEIISRTSGHLSRTKYLHKLVG
jgi:hypothetical protein